MKVEIKTNWLFYNKWSKFWKKYRKSILASESAKKRVAKYDKNNNLIQVYNSITEASRKNNINITSISYSANGKRKTGGGYIWHFV